MEGIWLFSYVVLWIVVLALIVLVYLLYRQLGIMYLGSAQGVSRDGLTPGTKAPDFSLVDQYGNPQRLADYRGRPTFLIFGSPSCSPCRVLLPQAEEWAAAHPDVGVVWLNAASADESLKFVSDMGTSLPVAAHDPDSKLLDRYRVRVTPFCFLVGPDGIIRTKGLVNSKGGMDLYYKEFKTGKPVEPEQAVPQGAS